MHPACSPIVIGGLVRNTRRRYASRLCIAYARVRVAKPNGIFRTESVVCPSADLPRGLEERRRIDSIEAWKPGIDRRGLKSLKVCHHALIDFVGRNLVVGIWIPDKLSWVIRVRTRSVRVVELKRRGLSTDHTQVAREIGSRGNNGTR